MAAGCRSRHDRSRDLSEISTADHAIAVFGAPASDDGSPRPSLRRRLECAHRLAQEDPEAIVIVSGGPVSGPVEADAMRDWLVARGIIAERVHVEPLARSTFENARYVARHLGALRTRVVTLVTEQFHLARSARVLRWAIEDEGLTVVVNAVAASDGLGGRRRAVRTVIEGVKLGMDWVRRRTR